MIYDYEPTNECYEQIELEIIDGELVNPYDGILNGR
jgi:hypothetical protein